MGERYLHVRMSKRKPPVAQQRQRAQAFLLQACQEHRHRTTPTFRPSETLCRVCGAVFYCPACFKEQQLLPAKNGHPRVCLTHRAREAEA
jgi:hypothetical protein